MGKRGRPQTTGKYSTREELEREVRGWLRVTNSFAKTAKLTGVSENTVATIFYGRSK